MIGMIYDVMKKILRDREKNRVEVSCKRLGCEYHYSIKFMNLTVAVINIKQMYDMHVETIREFMYKKEASLKKMYGKRKPLTITSLLKFHSLNRCSNGTPVLSSALHPRYGIIKAFGNIQHGNDFTIFHDREVSEFTYQLKSQIISLT